MTAPANGTLGPTPSETGTPTAMMRLRERSKARCRSPDPGSEQFVGMDTLQTLVPPQNTGSARGRRDVREGNSGPQGSKGWGPLRQASSGFHRTACRWSLKDTIMPATSGEASEKHSARANRRPQARLIPSCASTHLRRERRRRRRWTQVFRVRGVARR